MYYKHFLRSSAAQNKRNHLKKATDLSLTHKRKRKNEGAKIKSLATLITRKHVHQKNPTHASQHASFISVIVTPDQRLYCSAGDGDLTPLLTIASKSLDDALLSSQ